MNCGGIDCAVAQMVVEQSVMMSKECETGQDTGDSNRSDLDIYSICSVAEMRWCSLG